MTPEEMQQYRNDCLEAKDAMQQFYNESFLNDRPPTPDQVWMRSLGDKIREILRKNGYEF